MSRSVNVGELFVQQYGHRWRRSAPESRAKGVCSWTGCSRDYSVIYLGIPFCSHHEEWVERKLDEIFESEKGGNA